MAYLWGFCGFILLSRILSPLSRPHAVLSKASPAGEIMLKMLWERKTKQFRELEILSSTILIKFDGFFWFERNLSSEHFFEISATKEYITIPKSTLEGVQL